MQLKPQTELGIVLCYHVLLFSLIKISIPVLTDLSFKILTYYLSLTGNQNVENKNHLHQQIYTPIMSICQVTSYLVVLHCFPHYISTKHLLISLNNQAQLQLPIALWCVHTKWVYCKICHSSSMLTADWRGNVL